MSRIGKKSIELPENVTIVISETSFKAKGPLGELECKIYPFLKVEQEDKIIKVLPKEKHLEKDKNVKMYWGLTHRLVQNAIEGVSKGFEKTLVIEGVGYRAQMQQNKLVMNLGYSHPVEIEVPEGLSVTVKDNVNIIVKGIDKYRVGEFAALIRSMRKPEPYKGKGIRYQDEQIKRKVGKAGV